LRGKILQTYERAEVGSRFARDQRYELLFVAPAILIARFAG
jgi:hypothetical protein